MSIQQTTYTKYYHKSMFSMPTKAYRTNKVSEYLQLDDFQKSHIPYSDCQTTRAVNDKNRLVDLIRENEWNIDFLNEGLMKTYPVEKLHSGFDTVIKEFLPTELLKLTFSDIGEIGTQRIIDYKDHYSNDLHGMRFPLYEKWLNDKIVFKNLIKDLTDRLYIYGYNLSSIQIFEPSVQPIPDNLIQIVHLTFEAKFAESDYEMSKVLYHLTFEENLLKIRKNGLVPKSSSSKYEYPERVYLFNDAPIQEILNYAVSKSIEKDSESFVLLRIKRQKLKSSKQYINGQLKFYVDPYYTLNGKESAIYTYNNIPFNLIEPAACKFKVDHGKVIFKPTKIIL